ncbi:MAG: 2-amino-4-hydroxy-6-hydroxymethyldihydropteridine diphosphokinase [Gammaproteobacteria bacterium]
MTDRDIYIALGSNIEPDRHIPAALAALAPAYGPLARSPAYRSAAHGFTGADFVNCVVRGRADASPELIVAYLKTLEQLAGRRHGHAIGPRELDLDLILYGDEVITQPGLTIPRPDVLRYAFVLRPLADIAPEKAHPETRQSFAWHWEHFDGEGTPLKPISLECA